VLKIHHTAHQQVPLVEAVDLHILPTAWVLTIERKWKKGFFCNSFEGNTIVQTGTSFLTFTSALFMYWYQYYTYSMLHDLVKKSYLGYTCTIFQGGEVYLGM